MEILVESLKGGIAPAIVIAIYLIIVKIIDSKKESKQIKLNAEVVDCFAKLNKFLNYITEDIIDKEGDKCTNAIKSSFKACANSIIKFSINTIINNNIDINKETIIDNITNLINTEYYSFYNELSLYNSTNNRLTDYIKIEWKDIIKKDVINIIYNENLTKDQKIYNLNNKINIRFDDYCIYVINKYSKNA
jgi:hypothetical protein